MARYVVVQLDDNADADKLVSAINSGVVLCSVPDSEQVYRMEELTPGKAKAVGVYAKPTLFCECGGDRYKDTAQSQKFNWTVCLHCHKARRGWQYPVNLLGKGYDDYVAGRISRMRFYDQRMGFYSALEGVERNPFEDRPFPPTTTDYKGKRG